MNPYVTVAYSTFAIYLLLIAMLRIVGRHATSQLVPLDFLVVVLLGSAVETAMVSASTSLKVGLLSATVLFITNFALSAALRRWRRLRHLVNGVPTLLVHDGEFVLSHLRRVGLTKEDVTEALRAREVGCLDDVKFAVMEPDGRINVVKN